MTDLTETLKRIRERHASLQAEYDDPPHGVIKMEVMDQLHEDRGVLLDELERVTGELAVYKKQFGEYP